MQRAPHALVIGPQRVLDIVNMTGTLGKAFAGQTAVGQPLHRQWVISFPWLPDEGKFRGEAISAMRPLTAAQSG